MPLDTPAPVLLKMSAFAEKSGVPVPTVKHYLREGLLPAPVRTSRNMAYYDAALIPRVRAIKTLQKSLFLPLRMIKELLEGVEIGEDFNAAEFAMRVGIGRALATENPTETRTRASLLSAGVQPGALDMLRASGLVEPDTTGGDEGDERYSGDDLALLRLLGQARKAGLTHEMLPPSILGAYVTALQELVKVELSMFREGVVPHAGADTAKLAAVATELSERLVVLLRRKLLLPTLARLIQDAPNPGSAHR